MRALCFFVFALSLTACGAGGPTSPSAPAARPLASFNVPMDPGAISCSSLGNPAALTEATVWGIGQARGAFIAGRLASLPSEQDIAAALSSFCAANPSAEIRGALG